MPENMNNASCLMVKNDGIGDLVLTSGIISEVSRLFQGRLDLVTCKQNREIVEVMDGVRSPYYVSRDGLRFLPFISRLGFYIPKLNASDREIINKIRKIKYSHAIVLRRFIRQNTLIIMSFVKARHKHCAWQFPTNTTHDVARKFSKKYQHFQGDTNILSELEYYKMFIDSIFGSAINPAPRLNLPVSKKTDGKRQSIGLCIGGHSAVWPVGYWLDLASHLKARGYRIALFGGENDIKTGEMFQDTLTGLENHIGKLSLIESVEILNEMSVVVGNDTGMTHLASLASNRVIVLLGGGTFRRYFPWNDQASHHTIYYGMDCFDCDWECLYPQRLCLNMIRVSDVLDYLDEVISGKRIKKEKNLNAIPCQYRIAWKRRPMEDKVASC